MGAERILVTGAGGYMGSHLVNELLSQGECVRAFIKSGNPAESIQQNDCFSKFNGNICNKEDVEKAMQGCDRVYHLAAYAKNWSEDKRVFYDVNVQGTINVLEAAEKWNVKRVVCTSTAGVFGPQLDGRAVTENQRYQAYEYQTEYEKTKILAEKATFEFVERGQNVVIVNPTRVFGPGALSISNSGTKLIRKYMEGEWRIIPGDGDTIGNYAFVDDVVRGHILAMEKGKTGERYLLGGSNLTYDEFFDLLKEVTGKEISLYHMPEGVLVSVARGIEGISRLLRQPPLITPPWVKRYLKDWAVDSTKAQQELGYTITPIKEALRKTVDWLKTESNKQKEKTSTS